MLAEAKKQISERGYVATTVRSVASACGVGVGTVYNYFESKEMLIATFVYEDWKRHLSAMKALPTTDPEALLLGIYEGLKHFAVGNARLFSDTEAAKLISGGSRERHKMLRDQIASIVLPACQNANAVYSPLAAEFVAEALIVWSMEKADFEAVYPLLERIIKK